MTILAFVLSGVCIFLLLYKTPGELALEVTFHVVTLVACNIANGYVQFEPSHKTLGHYRVFKVFVIIHLACVVWFAVSAWMHYT